MNTISILGCGWLGFPLAKEMVSRGFRVNGSTTSMEKLQILNNAGIASFKLSFTPFLNGDLDFFDSEILIINIPPKAKSLGEAFHLTQIIELSKIIQKLKIIKNVIFISSTSVYVASGNTMYEDDANEHHFLFKAEKLLRDTLEDKEVGFTVLRCGGLMGKERIPCKYFSGKRDLDNGDTPVNYIHLEDVISGVLHVIENSYWNESYNLVAPHHPKRKELLEKTCAENGYVVPHFNPNTEDRLYKIVSSEKFISETGFKFKFPDPLEFRYL